MSEIRNLILKEGIIKNVGEPVYHHEVDWERSLLASLMKPIEEFKDE